MADLQDDRAARRARILAMKPEDRALLAEIMLKRHEQTVRDIAQLRARQADTAEWLAEFAPATVPPPDRTPSYLIWSNQHRMWWRPDGRGYTDSIEEAGRYPYARAQQIVLDASCNGALPYDRTDPVTGRQYRQAPEALVLAPEHVDIEGGVSRG